MRREFFTDDEIVHQWFEQALVETVIGIQQLRDSKEWGRKRLRGPYQPKPSQAQ
jgi:hypothetical protein